VNAGEVPVWYEVLSSKREELMEYMAGENIQTRPFAPSLHTSDYLDNPGEFPNSDNFSKQGMFLPCGPGQSLENVDRVIEALKGFTRSY
jgi:dTDP-4-amino-4,6-dideoxygalactose transaminase